MHGLHRLARSPAILIAGSAIALSLGLLGAWAALPKWADRKLNASGPAATVSERALRMHRELVVADLHADALLWSRSLLARNRRGHVDLPRLLEGGVGLQVFGIVTQVPRPIRARNDSRSDMISLLAAAQRWPRETRRSLKARALYQAGRLRDAASASDGRLVLIRTAADLKRFRAGRRDKPGRVAALLAVEGGHALEGDLANLDLFEEAGIRMMSPTHFADTELGGSSHGMERGGLTDLGREWLAELERRRMIVDVAHASERTIQDILALAKRPVVVSHTGVRGTCDNQRNLSDEQLRAIAAKGGLIGIGYWSVAVCGKDAAAVARAIRHAAGVAGERRVALGSDFDGATAAPFDSSRLAELTDALLAAGLPEAAIRRVMGENLLDFLEANLP